MKVKRKIDTFEIVALLFLSRASVLLTARGGASFSVWEALLGFVIAFFANALLMIPFFICVKKGGCSIMKGRWAIVFWPLFFGTALGTATGFQHFLSINAYEGGAMLMLALLLAAALYAAKLGIEPMARFAVLAFFIFIGAAAFLVAGLFPRYDLTLFSAPFHNGLLPALDVAAQMLLQPAEFVALAVLLPFQKGSPKASFWLTNFGELAIYELFTFASAAALGAYTLTQEFPVFALATVVEVSVFQRLDSVYLVVWVLTAFLRVSLFLWLASAALRESFPGMKRGSSLLINALMLAGGAYALTSVEAEFESLAWPWLGMLAAGLLVVSPCFARLGRGTSE